MHLLLGVLQSLTIFTIRSTEALPLAVSLRTPAISSQILPQLQHRQSPELQNASPQLSPSPILQTISASQNPLSATPTADIQNLYTELLFSYGFWANQNSSFRALCKLLQLLERQLASEIIALLSSRPKVLKMSEHGRLSIWKSEPTLDSWYNAAVNRNASVHDLGKSDMEEMLFFDISRSNQVRYPSSSANDWFFGGTTGDNANIEGKSNFSQF